MHALLVVPTLFAACTSSGPSSEPGGAAGGAAVDSGGSDGADGDGADDSGGATCGDGVVTGEEACDDGDANGATDCGCDARCQLPTTACDDGDPCTVDDACDGAGACGAGAPRDCDDGDACTLDTCEPDEGACSHTPRGGTGPALFDLGALRDASTVDLRVLDTWTEWEGVTPVTVHEISFASWDHEACEAQPVRIHGYLAVPPGASSSAPAPGLVVAHGLGGEATVGAASGPAADHGVVTLAYSGPGQGESEGWGSEPDHLFDTVPWPANSWFHGHAAAAMRALTVLEAQGEVDAGRLGMTGYSGGSVATLMVTGTDDRLTVSAPVSAVGHMDLAIAATPQPGWQLDLLEAMTPPRDASSAEWLAYVDHLDPRHFFATAHAPVLLINGAQDQFFPLDSTVATYDDLVAAQPGSRLLSIKDWDHGWYAYFGGDRAAELAAADLTWWLQGHLGLDSSLSSVPPTPLVVSAQPWTCLYDGWYPYGCALVVADVGAAGGYPVEGVAVHFSVDSALTFASWSLQDQGGGLWGAEVGTWDRATYDDSNTVYFVEVTYAGGVLGPDFALTSRPHLPPGFRPHLLPTDGPFP